MQVNRVDYVACKKLEPVFENGSFKETPKTTKAYIFIGNKKEGPFDAEVLEKEDVEYVHYKERGELFVNVGGATKLHAKDDIAIYHVEDKGYSLVAIRHGEASEDYYVFDKEGNVIAQIMNYRGEKNRLIGMNVGDSEISLFAESKSGAGDRYYYKLSFGKEKTTGRPEFYNLSAL